MLKSSPPSPPFPRARPLHSLSMASSFPVFVSLRLSRRRAPPRARAHAHTRALTRKISISLFCPLSLLFTLSPPSVSASRTPIGLGLPHIHRAGLPAHLLASASRHPSASATRGRLDPSERKTRPVGAGGAISSGTMAWCIFRKTKPNLFFAQKMAPKGSRSRSWHGATFTAGVNPAGVAHPAPARCG